MGGGMGRAGRSGCRGPNRQISKMESIRMIRSLKASALALLACLAFGAGSARATLVTVTEQVTGTGVLNGTAYTDALVTLSFVGDTADITSPFSTFYTFSAGTATVTVSGVGTDTFTGGLAPFVSQNFGPRPGIAGFGIVGFGTVLATYNSAFAPYDLSTSIGPISDESFIRPDVTFGTVGGSFKLTQVSSPSVYTAVVGSTAVPEPSTVALAGVAGLITLASARARRRRVAA